LLKKLFFHKLVEKILAQKRNYVSVNFTIMLFFLNETHKTVQIIIYLTLKMLEVINFYFKLIKFFITGKLLALGIGNPNIIRKKTKFYTR